MLAPDGPTKLFAAESTTKLGSTLVRNEGQTYFHWWLQKKADDQFVRQHRATQISTLRKELKDTFLGRSRGRNFVSGLASCGTRSSHRIEPYKYFATSPARLANQCKLGVNTLAGDSRPASAHRDALSATVLADGTWRRFQSMSPFYCHAKDCWDRALRARFVNATSLG